MSGIEVACKTAVLLHVLTTYYLISRGIHGPEQHFHHTRWDLFLNIFVTDWQNIRRVRRWYRLR